MLRASAVFSDPRVESFFLTPTDFRYRLGATLIAMTRAWAAKKQTAMSVSIRWDDGFSKEDCLLASVDRNGRLDFADFNAIL